MRKLVFLLILMPIVVYIGACSSQVDEIYKRPLIESRSVQQTLVKNQNQFQILAPHIYFDTISNSFYLDISLEEAIGKGVTASIYSECIKSLEKQTREAREIIDRGSKFSFINAYAGDYNPPVQPKYFSSGGYLLYPDFPRMLLDVPTSQSHFKGFRFFANAIVRKKNGDDSDAPSVWHTIAVSGYKTVDDMGLKKDIRVEDSRKALGNPRAFLGTMEFPGDIGDDAKPFSMGYEACLEANSYLNEDDTLIQGCCEFELEINL